MNINLKGKVALLTGAARGLGRATALKFAGAGASLFLVDILKDRLAETQTEVEQLGARCVTRVTDISAKDNCVKAVEEAVAKFGRLDVLCNIAAALRFHHFTDVTEEDWNRLVGVNLSGPFFLSQAAIPHLIKSQGNIVNVASQGAHLGTAYIAPYATTKAALLHLTKCMAMEYMKQPIRINAVSPGTMNTEIGEGLTRPNDIDPELAGRYSGIRPPTQPEEVAELILFAASDAARAIHGACLNADGGVTAG